MMSFDLLLDSSLAKLQRDGEWNVSHDFTIHFPSPIYLDSVAGRFVAGRAYHNELLMVQHRCLF